MGIFDWLFKSKSPAQKNAETLEKLRKKKPSGEEKIPKQATGLFCGGLKTMSSFIP